MKVPDIFYAAMTLTWVSVIAWALWPLDCPLQYEGGDAVAPKVVSQGGTISVTRKFFVSRESPVTLVRTLIKGDCEKSCETVDLPSSAVALAAGERRTQARDFTLPDTVDAGEWRVVFYVKWKDRIGREHSMKAPELTFTVV